MKNLKRFLLLFASTCLATAGFAGTADSLAKQAIPDLNSQDLGTISMSIFCGGGGGGGGN